ncbi:MAG: hypothetical protein ACRDE7_00115 [Sphingobacterium sp.]
MLTYNYTKSQFDAAKDLLFYYNEGDIIFVTSDRTGKVEKYVVETKKVFTKQPDWDERGKK